MPPSTVELPPRPIIIRRHPLEMAARRSSPRPKELVFIGFRSLSGTRGSPIAAADSMIAHFLLSTSAIPYFARIGSNRGPWTSTSSKTPPRASTRASTVPSPPSATGIFTVSASGIALKMPFSTASPASLDERQPLNESITITAFIPHKYS